MLDWLRNILGRRDERARPLGRMVRAKFDSAQTNADNRRHWANADGLSADAAASPAVRRTLRNRARYEVANNSYARGIVLTLANDVTGTGPRLQMLLANDDDAKTNQTIEREFIAWAKAVDLPGKLRTMRMARAQDGEAFALMHSNGGLASPVRLDRPTFTRPAFTGTETFISAGVLPPPNHCKQLQHNDRLRSSEWVSAVRGITRDRSHATEPPSRQGHREAGSHKPRRGIGLAKGQPPLA